MYKLRVAERGIYNVNVFAELPSRKSWPNFDARCRVYHRVAQRTYASLHKSAFALLVTYNYDAYYIEFPPQYWWKKSGILRGMHEHKYSFIIFPRPLGNEEFSFSIFPPINFILKGNIDEEEKDYVCFEDF